MTQQKREVAFRTVKKLALTTEKKQKDSLRFWSKLAF
jgi:hypothetical protein